MPRASCQTHRTSTVDPWQRHVVVCIKIDNATLGDKTGSTAGSLNMRFEHVKNTIGYPCIFSRSTEDAVRNLLQLITGRQCGFNEGPSAWHAVLQEVLDGQHDLLELNFCGGAFTADQWQAILKAVIDGLEVFMAKQSNA
jgi:hypothetical protein